MDNDCQGEQRPLSKLFAALLAAGALTLLPAQVPTPAPADPQPTEPAADSRRSLIDAGESPDLFVLYTGDVIGYLDPCG